MIKLFLFLALSSYFFLGCDNRNQVAESPKRLDSLKIESQKDTKKPKSMIIRMTWRIPIIGACKVTWFSDDFGAKQAIETYASSMGINIHILYFLIGGYRYEIDFTNKHYKKNPENGKGFSDLTGSVDPLKLDSAEKEMWDLRKLRTDTLIGKTCDVYSINNRETKLKSTFWLWDGIPLKFIGKTNGFTISGNATKISEDVKIPTSKFQLPDNFNLIE